MLKGSSFKLLYEWDSQLLVHFIFLDCQNSADEESCWGFISQREGTRCRAHPGICIRRLSTNCSNLYLFHCAIFKYFSCFLKTDLLSGEVKNFACGKELFVKQWPPGNCTTMLSICPERTFCNVTLARNHSLVFNTMDLSDDKPFWVNLFLICAWVFSTLKYSQKSYMTAECLLVRWALPVPYMTPVFRSRGNYDWWWFLPLLLNCLTSLRWYKMSHQKVIWDLLWERDFHLQVNCNFHLGFQHLFLSGAVSFRPPTQLLRLTWARGLI